MNIDSKQVIDDRQVEVNTSNMRFILGSILFAHV